MSKKVLSTKYQPQEVEAGKYEQWLEKGVFKPSENPNAEPYSIVIPPPNVTGKLHLGHAWDVTLQDMYYPSKTYARLRYVMVYREWTTPESQLKQKLKQDYVNKVFSRHDLGREKFLEKTWEWKEEYASHIREQWGKMGISVDYSP